MDTLRVALGERSYDILIGAGLLARTGELLSSLKLGKRGVIITDTNVEKLYAAKVRAGLEAEVIAIPAGESSKSLRQAHRLLEALPGLKLDRHSFVLALGGGVVGDLAGFVAATYLRGINFIQAPTSLLAMVDSSVGGKTGVNLPQGKNLVGAFYQPRLVLADTDTLKTLPDRERRAGFAEVIKMAAIRDAGFFAWLEENGQTSPAEAVRRCCEMKADVVSRDEREGGLRAILNFGHTVGHAVEALTDYEGVLHGEAVALGMCCAVELSVKRAGLKREEADRIKRLIAQSQLPTRLGEKYQLADLRAAMALDKKTVGGRLRFVLLKKLGEAVVSDTVTDADVEEAINVCR